MGRISLAWRVLTSGAFAARGDESSGGCSGTCRTGDCRRAVETCGSTQTDRATKAAAKRCCDFAGGDFSAKVA